MKWVGLIFLLGMLGATAYVFLTGPAQLRAHDEKLKADLEQRRLTLQRSQENASASIAGLKSQAESESAKRQALEAKIAELKAEVEALTVKNAQLAGAAAVTAPPPEPVNPEVIEQARRDIEQLQLDIAAKEKRLAEMLANPPKP